MEHDIEIHGDVIIGFEACDGWWCVFPYPGAGWGKGGDALLYRSLGCVRFSAALQADLPGLIVQIGAVEEGLMPKDWRRLDTLIGIAMEREFIDVCIHQPPVAHHHAYPDTGCSCGGSDCMTVPA